jgi:peptidoglycan/xylan/chitin deacetylase (PgdA/CDA1 family)
MRRQRRIPRRAVVITFDDGYADNLHNATPLLERQGVPATFFLSSGYVGQDQEFWWDELERLLLHPSDLPETLHVTVEGATHQWPLAPVARYSEEAFARDRLWNAMMPQERTLRQKAYLDLCRLLRTLLPEQRERVLEELRTVVGSGATGRQSHRALTVEETVALADSAVAEIGSHTVTHPVLAVLPVGRQLDELRRSRSRLEEIVGRPVLSFSYPFGARSDYTRDTIAAVRGTGFCSACSNFEGLVDRRTDPYQLPRFVVRDWDGETLSCRLEEWLRG